MKFTELPLKGAFVVEPELMSDERGSFARTFCSREFAEHGLDPMLVQCSISFNHRKGTLRGLHYQATPFEEDKLVRCTMGALFDVMVDLRPGSATFRKWCSAELTPQNRKALYLPKGFAHGFLTLADDTEILYQMSEFWSPGHGRGVRWNDPAFGIQWPQTPTVISPRDAGYPDFVSP
ncbi:MAG: dTDP-4-dehydrorhamnose 3,5-epimerase [Deltaproteobacteria bacterium]|nr:dTDP-4-dehydrorhamnose 3,5-epimerase [Deltaproteobacteria bacterium]